MLVVCIYRVVCVRTAGPTKWTQSVWWLNKCTHKCPTKRVSVCEWRKNLSETWNMNGTTIVRRKEGVSVLDCVAGGADVCAHTSSSSLSQEAATTAPPPPLRLGSSVQSRFSLAHMPPQVRRVWCHSHIAQPSEHIASDLLLGRDNMLCGTVSSVYCFVSTGSSSQTNLFQKLESARK